MPSIQRLRAVVAILLLAGAALFLVGVAVERAAVSSETSTAPHPSSTGSSSHVEGSGAEGTEEPHSEGGQSAAPATESHNSEDILGINVESWPLAIAAALASIVLALAAWRAGRRALLFAVAAFAFAFAVLDIREAIHQSTEARTGIVILAGLIALIHLAATALAVSVATRPEPQTAST